MKKFRLFSAAAVLALATAGVFANSAKFAGPGLYADVSGTKTQIDDATNFPGLTTTPTTNQAKIVSSASGTPQYNLYISSDGINFTAVYTTGF